MNQKKFHILIAMVLIGLAVAARLLPHPANFAPVAAVAIFGGAVLPRRYAITAPLLAMIVSDLIIGLHSLIAVTWGSYALIAFLSNATLAKPSIKKVVGVTIGGSMFFFVVTNFAVWLTSGMYEHTLKGLQQCFVMALPFFRNTATSDLIYTGALFGAYYLSVKFAQQIQKPATTNTN